MSRLRGVEMILILLMAPALWAADPNAGLPARREPNLPAGPEKVLENIPVAIFDFESKAPGNPDLGRQLGDVLTARLSAYDQFMLVERTRLRDVLNELQLNLSGLTEQSQAIKVGKVAGARILVFGRAFAVDRDLYIVAKIVGTETSQVKGIMVRGKLESDLSAIIDQLVEKLADGLDQWAPQLLPARERLENPIRKLRRELAGKPLPSVTVIVSEEHARRRLADPAAATEIKKVFKEVGFEVIEGDRETLEKWTKNVTLAGSDIVITGEGMSEFGAQLGGLTSCVARLEVQAVQRDSARVIAVARTTRRAVDLSEAIAAKTALQSAGHELALQVMETMAQEIGSRRNPESQVDKE
jgi:curli biogenesis system outer membrane secretion channel CsgG